MKGKKGVFRDSALPSPVSLASLHCLDPSDPAGWLRSWKERDREVLDPPPLLSNALEAEGYYWQPPFYVSEVASESWVVWWWVVLCLSTPGV